MKYCSKDLEGKKHHFGASGANTPSVSRKTSAEFRMGAPEGEAISMCKPSDKVYKYWFYLYAKHIHFLNKNSLIRYLVLLMFIGGVLFCE